MKYLYISLAVYLVVVSLVAIIATIKDKSSAKSGNWRIKESSLLLISLLGGSIAMLITMKYIRHKTQHLKFMLGIPLIILFQLAIIILIVTLS